MEHTLQDVNKYCGHHMEIALNLYRQLLLLSVQGNFVFCPLGILTSLYILGSGANRDTARDFQQFLKHDDIGTDAIVQKVLSRLIQFFNNDIPSVTFHLVHGLHVQNTFSIKTNFQAFVTGLYKAVLKNENFLDAEAAANSINQWIASNTKNKIKKVISSDNLDESTAFILTSAVYFKSDWINTFPLKNTAAADFHLINGQKKKVPMMMQTTRLNTGHHDTLKCSILEMPYSGNQLVMMIILPDESNGLTHIESMITPQTLKEFKDHLQPKLVNLQLPKFKIESGSSLKESLTALGLKSVFDEFKADLSEIAKEQLFVSEIQHQAMIDVDESGTEAAAATASNVRRSRSTIQETNFHADHPFLFYIMEKNTGYVLFLGRFVEVQDMALKDEL